MNQKRPSLLWLLPTALFLLAVFVVPVISLVAMAADSSRGLWTELAMVWTRGHTRRALLNAVMLSAAVSTAAMLLCLPPAQLLARSNFRGRNASRLLLSLPLAFSGVIVGFLAIVMLGRVGVIPTLSNALFGKPYGSGLAYALPGLFLAYLFFEIPRAVLSLEAAFTKLDPELDAAARTLGANRWQRWRRVKLPALWPPLAGTFATTFAVSLGSFGAALILSRRFFVLPVEIFTEFTAFSNDAGACAMAIWLAGVSALVSLVAARAAAHG